jgi:hypothetical protein
MAGRGGDGMGEGVGGVDRVSGVKWARAGGGLGRDFAKREAFLRILS